MSSEKWTTEKIPSQKGKIIIVTGSSSGIGYEAARVLADKGAEVIVAVRNEEKGKNAINKIKDKNPAAIEELKAGNNKSMNFLMGQVMRLSKGKATPKEVMETIKSLI